MMCCLMYFGSVVMLSPVFTLNGVLVVMWCRLMRYFVLWSGIVYCDGRVVLWWWCLGDLVELSCS